MTRRAPHDSDLLKAIGFQLHEPPPEQIVFFGTDNQVLDVFYPAQFNRAEIQASRSEFEKRDALKAIVHAYIPLISDRETRGPRVTFIEMVAGHRLYAQHTPSSRSMWTDPAQYPAELAYAQKLWGNGKED